MQVDTGFCANHPDRESTFLCDRCGSFGCVECESDRLDVALCQTCAAVVLDESAASWLAVAAASTGFLGLTCCLPAPVGLVLGVADLLRGGASRPGSLKLDLLGIGLGLFGIVTWIAVIVLGPDPAGPYE